MTSPLPGLAVQDSMCEDLKYGRSAEDQPGLCCFGTADLSIYWLHPQHIYTDAYKVKQASEV